MGMQGTGQHREGSSPLEQQALILCSPIHTQFSSPQVSSSMQQWQFSTLSRFENAEQGSDSHPWRYTLTLAQHLNEGEIISVTLEPGSCLAQNIFWLFLWKAWSSHHFPIQLNSIEIWRAADFKHFLVWLRLAHQEQFRQGLDGLT